MVKSYFNFFNNLLRNKGYANFKGIVTSLFAKNVLIGIGSVLHVYDRKNVIVWGSGIIKSNSKIFEADFRAVRGMETIRRLNELGYKTPKILGDPALLLPLIIKPNIRIKNKIGIVPNYKQFDEIKLKYSLSPEFSLIDLRDDILSVTNEMTSCEYIIATSLHGLIVAHAYNIPAIWVDLNVNTKLAGDDIKFKDYFSSVNIDYYSPYNLRSLIYNEIKYLIEENKSKCLINCNLLDIQKGLLSCFPYPLKDKYKDVINAN